MNRNLSEHLSEVGGVRAVAAPTGKFSLPRRGVESVLEENDLLLLPINPGSWQALRRQDAPLLEELYVAIPTLGGADCCRLGVFF